EALNILLALGKKHHKAEAGSLAMCYLNLAGTLAKLQHLGKAEDLYLQVAAMYKQLAEAYGAAPEHRRHWATCLWGLADIHEKTGRLPRAEQEYQQAIKLLLPLVRELPDELEAKKALANCYFGLAELFMRTNRLTAAEGLFGHALKLQRELVKCCDESEVWDDLAGTCSSLGELLRLLRRFDEAAKVHEESVSVAEKAVARHPGVPSC